jgi:hypothetical protein
MIDVTITSRIKKILNSVKNDIEYDEYSFKIIVATKGGVRWL